MIHCTKLAPITHVAYYNVLSKISRETSISTFTVNSNVDRFDVLIRKQLYGFRKRM